MRIETPYMTVPFVPNGVSWKGADCWGLIILFYKREFNIQLASYSSTVRFLPTHAGMCAPKRLINDAYLRAINSDDWVSIANIADARVGDVLTFSTGGIVYHVGLYISPTDMLHTQSGIGVGVTRFDHPEWRTSDFGIYRHVDRINC